VLTIFEEAVSLVRNATKSQDVAKGRALAYIAAKGVGILPLVEAANAQAKDWEKIRRQHEVQFELFSRDPQARQVIGDFLELHFKIVREAEKRHRAKLIRESEFSPASEENKSLPRDSSSSGSSNESFSPRKNEN
jgi:hypothetical protein